MAETHLADRRRELGVLSAELDELADDGPGERVVVDQRRPLFEVADGRGDRSDALGDHLVLRKVRAAVSRLPHFGRAEQSAQVVQLGVDEHGAVMIGAATGQLEGRPRDLLRVSRRWSIHAP